jgi:hypothetical protein
MIDLKLPERPAFDRRPVKVDRWYDRKTRCWVVQTLNAAGDQLGDATYVHHKRSAVLDAQRRLNEIATYQPED